MKLTFASGLYDRMQALYTKQVQPEGIELDFIINENPRDIFNRKLRLIAVSTLDRFPMFPKVPTLDESGVKGFEGSSWQGLTAPAGVPRDIVARINKELVSVLHTPAMRQKVLDLGGVVVTNSPAQFEAFFKAEATKWSAVATKAGLLKN